VANEIVRMGALNSFEVLFSKCGNSLIGLCLGVKETKFVDNENV
jgi:hypothetical protein